MLSHADAEQSFVVDVDDLDHAGSDSLLMMHKWLGLMAYQERMVGHCLIEQQKSDGTLESMRGWAKSSERGYGFQNRIIVHREATEHGEEWTRIVVPNIRRKDILKLSHSSLTGGPFLLGKQWGY